jgi:dihydrodipicolinate synthase/N-acetylneuraminate lyase
VITTKVTYPIDHLLDDIAVAGHRINFLPGQNNIYPAYQMARTRVTGCWSTSAVMGPEPIVALMEAIRADDATKVAAIWADLQSIPPFMPQGEAAHFPEYNVQAEKARFNAAGYISCGPSRAPYRDLPEQWRTQAELHGRGWTALRARYAKSPTTVRV